MSIKPYVKVHMMISTIVGIILGVVLILSDSNGSVNNLLALPLGITLSFIGYGGPVIAGLFAIRLTNRKRYWNTFRTYLFCYYLLLVLLIIQLWVAKNNTDSGLAILLLPWLPIPAVTVGTIYNLVINRSGINRQQ